MTERTPDNEAMKKSQRVEYVRRVAEEEADLGEYLAILRPDLKKIIAYSLLIGIAMLLYMYTKPNRYLSSALITPVVEERQNPAFGALASFGLSVGGPTKLEELEALLESNDLAVRVFQGNDLWSVVMPDSYDPKTGKMKVGWLSSLLDNDVVPKPPGEWNAIGAAKGGLVVTANRKTGTLSLSFESVSREGSVKIVRIFLEEAKNRLQEEAFLRASKNKKFIEERIGKTVDALTRDRLYSLYGQEVEKEMMAGNREQFGFRIIDSPRVPNVKSRPKRARNATAVAGLSFILFSAYFIHKKRRKRGHDKNSVRIEQGGLPPPDFPVNSQ